MKKFTSWALALLVSVSGFFCSCSDDKNDDAAPEPTVPSVALSRSDVSSSSLKFALALENAERAYYLCTEKEAPVPTALELLTAETFVTESGTVTIDELEPATTYRIAAIAVQGKATGRIETLEITTSAPDAQPAVELTKGTEGFTSLTFTASLTDTERAAYVCIAKTDDMALPSAEEILADGTAIEQSGEVTIEELASSTVYVIAAAGANGTIFSEVASIEMTTQTPAPEIVLEAGETTENSLSFTVELTHAERAAYVCIAKTDDMTLPSAEEILADGTAIEQSGEIVVEELDAATAYVIAVAAANKEIVSEVASTEMTTDISVSGPAAFDRQATGGYYGDSHDSGYAEFHFVLADAETTEQDGVYTTVGAGRAMSFDLFQFAPFTLDNITLPARTYRYGTNYGMNTFDPAKTYCMVRDAKGNVKKIEFKSGTIDVQKLGTTYTIKAELVTTTDEPFTASYEGKIEIENKVSGSDPGTLPALEKDLTGLSFIRAFGKYYGGTTADNCIVNLYDVEPNTDYGTDYLSKAGHLVSLDLSTAVSETATLQEGTYEVSSAYRPGTFFAGYEETFMGSLLAMGTYCEERNDSYESIYGMITGGTVTITKVGDGYRFVLDFVTSKNHKVTGSYEGKVEMTDKRTSSTVRADRAQALKLSRR